MVSYTKSFRAWVVVAAAALASGMFGSSSAQAELTITGVGKVTPQGMLTGLSGITYAGGNQYYAVSDSGGLVSPLAISMDGAGAITSVTVGTTISLNGAGSADLEGIAYRAAGHGGGERRFWMGRARLFLAFVGWPFVRRWHFAQRGTAR